jgi:hypothetical protein
MHSFEFYLPAARFGKKLRGGLFPFSARLDRASFKRIKDGI